MKYIILNDLEYIFKEKYKLIESFLFVIILYFFMIKPMFSLDFDNETYHYYLNTILGYKVNILAWSDISTTIFSFLNFGIYFYIAFLLLLKDLDNLDNLLPRISFIKWLNIKILIQFLICILLQTIIFIPVYLTKIVKLSFYLVILKKALVVTILVIYLYLLIIFFSKNKIIFTILLLILGFLIIKPIDISTMNFNYILITTVLALLLNMIICSKVKFSDLGAIK